MPFLPSTFFLFSFFFYYHSNVLRYCPDGFFSLSSSSTNKGEQKRNKNENRWNPIFNVINDDIDIDLNKNVKPVKTAVEVRHPGVETGKSVTSRQRWSFILIDKRIKKIIVQFQINDVFLFWEQIESLLFNVVHKKKHIYIEMILLKTYSIHCRGFSSVLVYRRSACDDRMILKNQVTFQSVSMKNRYDDSLIMFVSRIDFPKRICPYEAISLPLLSNLRYRSYRSFLLYR